MCLCVHKSIAPLCPSSLAWLLSCGESASFWYLVSMATHPSMKSRLSTAIRSSYRSSSLAQAPPAPSSSPFPYITLPSTTSPGLFCLYPTFPTSPSPFRASRFNTSSRAPYFLCIFSTDLFCFVICPCTPTMPPSYMSQMNSLCMFASWAITAELQWVFLEPAHSSAFVFLCLCLFSPAELCQYHRVLHH